MVASTLQEVLGWAIGAILKSAGKMVVYLANSIMRGEDAADPVFRDLTEAAVRDLTGADPKAGHGTIGQQILNSITGGAGAAADGEIAPSSAGAEAYLEAIMKLTLEGYLEGAIVSSLSLNYLEKFAELDDMLAQVLGLGRLSRRVVGPLLDARVVRPFLWQTNKAYRPELLSPASVVRQFLRGKWAWEDCHEELARQGYSEARIDALLNEQRKFIGVSDVRQLLSRGEWTQDQALQHLRDQGYDDAAAELALRVEGSKRFEQLENAEAALLTAAYASRDIDAGEFRAQLAAHVRAAPERALITEQAELRRALNIRRLTSAEVAAAVEEQILAYPDYREALRREGYPEPDITVKELLLRARVDKEHSIEEHRRALEAERAAEKLARDQAAAEKRAQLEADRARKRRGAAGELERAVVRGLIPISRYAEVLQADYDPDTVDIYVDLVEDDRQRYLEQQQRAAAAAQRANVRGLNMGELRAAVLAGVLTVDQFTARLAFEGIAGDDAAILTATLEAQLADQAAAQQQRRAAETTAKKRGVDLSRLEYLVRKGLRSFDEYDRTLEQLGLDEAARAVQLEYLQQKIDEDAAAADARAAADADRRGGQLTVDEFRRAVLLGQRTPDDFDRYLTASGLSADRHALLMGELVDDLAQADAARQRREQAGRGLDTRALPLASVTRAARLGIISVDAYRARLERDGYDADAIATEVELLLLEIADVQQARAQRDQAARELAPKGLSLPDLVRAVKAGAKSLDDYQAALVDAGLSADAIATQLRVLGDELAETKAAAVRRTEIASTLKPKEIVLSELENQVRAGALSLEEYYSTLIGAGIAAEDADVLWTLLADELAEGAVRTP